MAYTEESEKKQQKRRVQNYLWNTLEHVLALYLQIATEPLLSSGS